MNVGARWIKGLSATAALFLLGGCAHFPGGIAPSNTPIEGRKYKVLGPVKATDSCVSLFGFLPISGSNSTRAAIKAAIDSRDADAMIDITVECYDQYWILFTRHITAVYGKAIMFDR